MFKILIWKNSKDVELKAVLKDYQLKTVVEVLKERGLTFKIEDLPTVSI